ncbi:GGDEF domain-containing protein [Loktanella salsilacus]|uniref:GGDEF domain-containing protein n=1 Tax=Loktanella salsilacus TaxID=195913 RepID=UPI0037357C7A
MDRLVKIIAPRNAIDFVCKALVFLFVISLMNWARDYGKSGADHNGFMYNLRDAAIVGTPFILLSLALVGHLARLQAKLLRLATTDMLTNLPNRRAFLDDIAGGDQLRARGALLMIDLDHFKRINDSYGHHVGDICLRAAADFLREHVTSHMSCARLGGEEFGIFVPGDAPNSAALAGRLAHGLQVDLPQTGLIEMTMSIGMTEGDAGQGLGVVMARADRALYVAKAQGRAQVATWSPQIERQPFPKAG